MTSSTRWGRDATSTFGSFASMLIGHCYWDVRAGLLYRLNDAARQLHEEGIPFVGSEAGLAHLQTPWGEAVRGDDLPTRTALREGRPAEAAFVFSLPGKPPCHLLWSATPLPDPGGQVTAVLVTVCRAPPPPDWHALAELAHDLRSPLQILRVLLVVLGNEQLPAQQAEAMQRLHFAAERALQIAADLLAWCRAPAAGGRPAQSSWTPLESLLVKLVQEQGPVAGEKGLRLNAVLTEVRGWEVHTDPVRFGRIVMNLLGNAVRYTPPGGQVSLTAAWEEQAGERALVLGVSDTGPGISLEEQESIFQPFERGRSGHGDSSSTGLGLAVVDRLIKELGLQRAVASEPGLGSTFRVLVPQQLLRCAAGPAAPAAGTPASGPPA